MSKREQIINRVKSLMDLARSDNPHEAELAAERAQEIIERHRITDEEMKVHDEYSMDNAEAIVLMRSGRIQRWQHVLAVGIATANYCRYVQNGNMLIAIGRSADLDFVRFLWDYLYEECKRHWRKIDRDAKMTLQISQQWAVNFGVERLQGTKARNSFLLGMASNIAQRMLKAKEKAKQKVRKETAESGNTQALAKIDANVAALQKWEKVLDDEIKSKSKRREFKNEVDEIAFHVGVREGTKVNIPENRPLGTGEEQNG